jgi:Peptidase propeptide and YPEB domain
MRINRRLTLLAVALVALAAAAAAGIAQAVSGSGEEQLIGSTGQRAAVAALTATGGGKVLEMERQDGDGAGVYEVEVRRPDGSQVEVHLNAQFQPVGTVADDDSGSESNGTDD